MEGRMTADLWSLLDQYTHLAAIAWWVWVVAIAASAAIAVTGAGWGAWRIGRGIRRRAVRKAARHRLYVRRILRAEEQRARQIDTCKDIWPDAPEWGTAA
jgi:hypothetical protein